MCLRVRESVKRKFCRSETVDALLRCFFACRFEAGGLGWGTKYCKRAAVGFGAKGVGKAGNFGSTSVMAWCGYDAPQTIPQAGLDGYADGGAGSLDRFQDGLRASHDGTH
ncbi:MULTISPECIES: alpha/beta hydrolase [Rhodococcus]|uniref:alpha/beta hydrolase n=1 Tax=Rhodococcus TaxID=1827 RepID=UPI0034CED5A3